jgi:2-polyprenyl-6-hydroxyphenyl methylase/3-demethylubiquinone-9 3-methyltransferase
VAGYLFQCETCGLGFRNPSLDQSTIDALYASAPLSNDWSNPLEPRPDWKIARTWLAEVGAGLDILDIGCWDGEFLASLPTGHRLNGIEGALEASRRARERNVQLVAKKVEEFVVKGGEAIFDVVTAFDVIEHIRTPRSFMEMVADVTRPGGRIIISSGNFHAREFSMMGPSYWYCVNPEHLSFVSPEWITAVASSLRLQVVRTKRFSHMGREPLKYVKQMIANSIYRLSPRAFGRLRKLGLGHQKGHRFATLPPSWPAAPDHFIVELAR